MGTIYQTTGSSLLVGAGAPSAESGVNGDFYIDSTTGSLYGPKAAGAWGSALGGGKAALSADVGPIKEQTTLQNVTGLGVSIGASATEIWLLKYWLLVNAANNVMDVKLGFTVPASATMQWGLVDGNSSVALAGWGGTITTNTPTALASSAATLSLGTVNNGTTGIPLIAIVYGGGTAGTVQLQYAQNTSDAGNLKIVAGSVVEAAKVAA